MSILRGTLFFLQKTGYFALEYLCAGSAWGLRLIKIQTMGWGRCRSRKALDKAFSVLGSEIYSLAKAGDFDWRSRSEVMQMLKHAEDAETRFLKTDSAVEEINENYRKKREEIRNVLAAKRAGLSREKPSD